MWIDVESIQLQSLDCITKKMEQCPSALEQLFSDYMTLCMRCPPPQVILASNNWRLFCFKRNPRINNVHAGVSWYNNVTMRTWALKRRVEYGSYVFLLLAIVVAGGYLKYFYTPSSCFDNEMNNDERAVDCGGSCVRICAFDVIPLEVVWVESFQVFPDQYNAVAYIQNKNKFASTPELNYTFKLFSEDGLIAEVSNTTILPPDSVYPIFEGRIRTNGEEVVRTEIEIEDSLLWQPATIGRDQFVTRDFDLIAADLAPRLNVTLANTELTEAKNVEVVATIFDASGRPLTASQTFVEIFAPRSDENLVFTWPVPISKTVRSCEVPTDVVVGIDLSGSMNNDGGDPPEPISSVLEAASNFVERLREKDQVSVATFATNATIETALTGDVAMTKQTIESLTISPSEENGSTNTGDVLRRVRAELGSPRHNPDARKVLVLLTDGLATAPDPNPEGFAIEEARDLKNENVEIYTVGLGEEVNKNFLSRISDEPKNAYFAASIEDLNEIYSNISTSLCEAGAARIDIIPKTDANFTPLR